MKVKTLNVIITRTVPDALALLDGQTNDFCSSHDVFSVSGVTFLPGTAAYLPSLTRTIAYEEYDENFF